jgi:hypothetical protein
MGTTLTGTTPQDTYDSLIKVTDNGPLSGTAKYLSDGLGNDSALALSTTAVGIGTNTPASLLNLKASNGQFLFQNGTSSAQMRISAFNNAGTDDAAIIFEGYTKEYARITSAGNVGIGTNAPAAKLQTTGTDAASVITGIALENFIATNPSSGNGVAVDFRLNNSGNTSAVTGRISTVNTFFRSNTDMVFSTFTSDTLTEKVRIQSGGGISFNGDTAAANALDDYEEGTWTMGISFGGASVGLTTSINTGTYIKIGRQVTISGQIALSNKGSSTGIAQITGLPFTVAGSAPNFAAPSFRTELILNTGIIQGYTNINTTLIPLEQVSVLGVATSITNADFANNTTIIVSATYFV